MAVHCEENVLQYRKENIKGGPIVQKSNAIFSAVPMCPKCATRGLTYVSRNCQHPGGERHRRHVEVFGQHWCRLVLRFVVDSVLELFQLGPKTLDLIPQERCLGHLAAECFDLVSRRFHRSWFGSRQRATHDGYDQRHHAAMEEHLGLQPGRARNRPSPAFLIGTIRQKTQPNPQGLPGLKPPTTQTAQARQVAIVSVTTRARCPRSNARQTRGARDSP